MRVGPYRRLSTKELLLSNCGVGEDSGESPWTARRSNQSILKEINSEYSLEGLMPPDVNGQLIGKDPDAGKTGGRTRDNGG